MDEIDLLIAKHKELVKLYIHEGEMSWNSAYFHLVLNLGLISAIGVIVSIGGPLLFGIISLLSVFGALMNFLGFFSLSRTNVYRHFFFDEALKVEEQIREHGLTLDSFQGLNVAKSDEDLKWHEKVRVHRFQKQQVMIIGIIWLSVAILTAMIAGISFLYSLDC